MFSRDTVKKNKLQLESFGLYLKKAHSLRGWCGTVTGHPGRRRLLGCFQSLLRLRQNWVDLVLTTAVLSVLSCYCHETCSGHFQTPFLWSYKRMSTGYFTPTTKVASLCAWLIPSSADSGQQKDKVSTWYLPKAYSLSCLILILKNYKPLFHAMQKLRAQKVQDNHLLQ